MYWTDLIIPLVTVLSVFIANATMIFLLFLWERKKSIEDIRNTNAILESTRDLIISIQDEMKKFHAKLRLIEKGSQSDSKR